MKKSETNVLYFVLGRWPASSVLGGENRTIKKFGLKINIANSSSAVLKFHPNDVLMSYISFVYESRHWGQNIYNECMEYHLTVYRELGHSFTRSNLISSFAHVLSLILYDTFRYTQSINIWFFINKTKPLAFLYLVFVNKPLNFGRWFAFISTVESNWVPYVDMSVFEFFGKYWLGCKIGLNSRISIC